MVDYEARREYAELLRQFISGRMTNAEYESRYEKIKPHADDRAVAEVYHQVWFLYDDIQTQRMTGQHRLDRAGHREIAKTILFLQNGQEYVWPLNSFLALLGCLGLMLPWAVIFMLGLLPNHIMWVLWISAGIGLLYACIYGMVRWQAHRRWNETGEVAAWPFRRQADLEEAIRHPHLLNGKQ